MSQFHDIFCRSEDPLTRADLMRIATEAWSGDGDLNSSPSLSDDASRTVHWRELVLLPPGARRPITIVRDTDEEDVRMYVAEIFDEAGDGLPETVESVLRSTRQVFGIEIFPEHLDDDAWEMLDVLQSILAKDLDGVIVTPDGIYDQNLRVLAEW